MDFAFFFNNHKKTALFWPKRFFLRSSASVSLFPLRRISTPHKWIIRWLILMKATSSKVFQLSQIIKFRKFRVSKDNKLYVTSWTPRIEQQAYSSFVAKTTKNVQLIKWWAAVWLKPRNGDLSIFRRKNVFNLQRS